MILKTGIWKPAAGSSKLPPPAALELVDPAHDQLAADAAQVVHEQDAVEMIHFVLEGTRREVATLDGALVAVGVNASQRDARRPEHRRVEAGHAETSLLFELRAAALHDLGIDQRHQLAGFSAGTRIDDQHPERDPNLGCRETNPGRRVHRFDQVVHELPHAVVEGGDCFRFCGQAGIAVLENWTNHSARARNLSRAPAAAASIARVISAIESPPNFSSRASARTSATIASPTTAAAGTAQTSLRSMAACASSIVARSTDRRGFMSVEIGFIHAETRTSSPLVTPPSRPPALLVGRARPMARDGSGTISSWTRDPGRPAASGPMPTPTA